MGIKKDLDPFIMQEKEGLTVGDPLSQGIGQLQNNFWLSKALNSYITFPNGFKVKGTTIKDNKAGAWVPELELSSRPEDDSKQALFIAQNN